MFLKSQFKLSKEIQLVLGSTYLFIELADYLGSRYRNHLHR